MNVPLENSKIKMASPPSSSFSSLSLNIGKDKFRQSPYLERVGEALSKALSKMEKYETPLISNNNNPKPFNVFRPHVELGTAPIDAERIEEVQKIRPFRSAPSKTNTNENSGWKGNQKTVYRTTTAKTVVTKTATATKECCLIESTSNSIRISFLFKAQAKTQSSNSADPLETSILFQWMRFLMVQEQHPLLRKKPLEGYSVTFLVTNRHLATHGISKVQESILSFCAGIDKECSDIKLQVNAQARYITTEFCKAFNQTENSTVASEYSSHVV